MTKYFGKTVGIPIEETSINVSNNENNSGALILAKCTMLLLDVVKSIYKDTEGILDVIIIS